MKSKTVKPSMAKIAIVSHDGKKAEMVDFMLEHKEFLENSMLFATKTTGGHVERVGLKVQKMLSGPLGGDAQIGAMVAEGKLDLVVFFRDPLDAHPHETDVQMLMRICDVHAVPLATNPASASLVMKGLVLKGTQLEERRKPEMIMIDRC